MLFAYIFVAQLVTSKSLLADVLANSAHFMKSYKYFGVNNLQLFARDCHFLTNFLNDSAKIIRLFLW